MKVSKSSLKVLLRPRLYTLPCLATYCLHVNSCKLTTYNSLISVLKSWQKRVLSAFESRDCFSIYLLREKHRFCDLEFHWRNFKSSSSHEDFHVYSWYRATTGISTWSLLILSYASQIPFPNKLVSYYSLRTAKLEVSVFLRMENKCLWV